MCKTKQKSRAQFIIVEFDGTKICMVSESVVSYALLQILLIVRVLYIKCTYLLNNSIFVQSSGTEFFIPRYRSRAEGLDLKM